MIPQCMVLEVQMALLWWKLNKKEAHINLEKYGLISQISFLFIILESNE